MEDSTTRQQKEEERLLFDSGEWEHLPYFVLRGLVLGRLDAFDKEIAETHIADCLLCAADVRELRAVENELSALPIKKYAPSLPVSENSEKSSPANAPAAPNFLATVRNLLFPPRTGWVAPAAAATACGLLYVLAIRPAQQQAIRSASALEAALRELEQVKTQRETVSRERDNAIAEAKEAKMAWERLRGNPSPSPAPVSPTKDAQIALLQKEVAALRAERNRLIAAQKVPSPANITLPKTLRLPDLSGLRPEFVTLRGTAEAKRFRVVSPNVTRVAEERPLLTWEPYPGAVAYEVILADRQDNEIARTQTRLTATQWTPPNALPRGTMLVWQVSAYDAAGKEIGVTEGRFVVLTAEEAARRTQRVADSPLTAAVRDAEAGLLDAADKRFEAIAADTKARPEIRKRAEEWRDQIRAYRKRLLTPPRETAP